MDYKNIIPKNLKCEAVKEETVDETLAESSVLRDDNEDFILPSQSSQRSELEHRRDFRTEYSEVAFGSLEVSKRKQTIEESLMVDETFDESYCKPTQVDRVHRVHQSEDLFGTQTQIYEPGTVEIFLEGTPVVRGHHTIPETPVPNISNLSARFDTLDSIPETPNLSRLERLTGKSSSCISGGSELFRLPSSIASAGTDSQRADTQPVHDASLIILDPDVVCPEQRKSKRRWDVLIDLESSNSLLEGVSLEELNIPPSLPGKDMKDFVAGVLGDESQSSQDSNKSGVFSSPKKTRPFGKVSPVKATGNGIGRKTYEFHCSSPSNASIDEIELDAKNSSSRDKVCASLTAVTQRLSPNRSPETKKDTSLINETDGESGKLFTATYKVQKKLPSVEISTQTEDDKAESVEDTLHSTVSSEDKAGTSTIELESMEEVENNQNKTESVGEDGAQENGCTPYSDKSRKRGPVLNPVVSGKDQDQQEEGDELVTLTSNENSGRQLKPIATAVDGEKMEDEPITPAADGKKSDFVEPIILAASEKNAEELIDLAADGSHLDREDHGDMTKEKNDKPSTPFEIKYNVEHQENDEPITVDREKESPVHENTQPVMCPDDDKNKEGTGEEKETKNVSLNPQERTLSPENFHTAPDMSDTEPGEPAASPEKDEGSTSHLSDVITIEGPPFFLEVSWSVEFCKTTNNCFRKKITKVRPVSTIHPTLESSSEYADKSKMESTSSGGSVYSDKIGLPFTLQSRASLTSSTSTSDDLPQVNPVPVAHPGDVQAWKNDCLLPLACDEALDRHLARNFAVSRELLHKVKKTPLSRLSFAKALFDKALIATSGSLSKESSIEAISEAKEDPKVETPKCEKEIPFEKSTPKRTRRAVRGKSKTEKGSKKNSSPCKTIVAAVSSTPAARRRGRPPTRGKEVATAIDPSTLLSSGNSLNSSSEVTATTLRRAKKSSEKGSDAIDRNTSNSTSEESVNKSASKKSAAGEASESSRKKLRLSETESTPVLGKKSLTPISSSGIKMGRGRRGARTTPTYSLNSSSEVTDPTLRPKTRTTKASEKGSNSSDPSSSKKTLGESANKTAAKKRGAGGAAEPARKKLRLSAVESTPTKEEKSQASGSKCETKRGWGRRGGRTAVKYDIQNDRPSLRLSSGSSSDTPLSDEPALIDSPSLKKSFTPEKRGKRPQTPVPGRTYPQPAPLALALDGVVFAKWASDRFFYPGVAVEYDGKGKWTVRFAEGTQKPVNETFMLPLRAVRVGHLVQVLDDEGYSFGLITDIHPESKYVIEVEGETREVKLESLRLTEDQFKQIQKDKAGMSGTPSSYKHSVDPDNIVSEKRRGGATGHSDEAEPSAGSSKEKEMIPLSSVDTSLEFTPGLDMDEIVISNISPRTKTAPGTITPKSKRRIFKAEDKSATDESSGVFAGMFFLLCYVKSKRLLPGNKAASKTSSDSNSSGAENAHLYYRKPYDSCPFDEAHLRLQLIAGGGLIYDRFADVPTSQYKNTWLVTNRPNRSAKFLLCLVHGIKIVLHLHIMEACRGQDLRRMKLNHVGWSNAFSRWLGTPPNMSKTFKDKHIYIYSKSEDTVADSIFKSFWTLILKKAGASVIEDIDYAEVIVTDASLPQEIRESVEAIGNTAPTVVSTRWVIESLLKGYPLDSKLHPSFHYCYASSS